MTLTFHMTQSTTTVDKHLILFGAPKQGGILQSSGFLDLKSLVALSQTAKAHAMDEQSLILLIENELTRSHEVQTMDEALDFLRQVFTRDSMSTQWLRRSTTEESIKVTRHMLHMALIRGYDVMCSKMLRKIPE